MTFIYLDYEMKIMVPMCLTRLWESSNVINVKLISKMKRVYNNLNYTISFGADEILEHLKYSTILS